MAYLTHLGILISIFATLGLSLNLVVGYTGLLSITHAAFLILLPEILRFVGFPSEIAAQMRQVIYGLLLVGLMLYRPQGLLGKYKM